MALRLLHTEGMPTLDWIGKRAVVNHHRELPYRLLHCDDALGAGEAGSGNLLVEGDNLHALKALLPYYAGKVKCIYIDPPYNTGNEGWVYNDNVNAPEIQKWLGETVGKEAEDLSRHDKWLCMMYPRLALLREFLKDDGVIFVSIDDAEIGNLYLVADEIFGKPNRRATIVWQHSLQPKGYSGKISVHHNYLVAYAKSDAFIFKDIPRREEHNVNYSNPDNDPKGKWRAGDVRNALYRPNLIYDLVTPSGKVIKPPSKGWRWSRETMAEKIKSGEIVFRADETKILRKIYLEGQEGRPPETIWFGDDVGTTREANQELKDIFNGQSPFDTPKPSRILKRVIQISTLPGDLILDSFAGSGTTGHAALALNKEDGGKRQFILCEIEPRIAREITSERLKRVIGGYGETPGLGGGFRFCTLGEPLFDANGSLRANVKWGTLAHHLWFSETGEPWSESYVPAGGLQCLTTGGPMIGVAPDGRAVYLMYGSLQPDDQHGTLTPESLPSLAPHDGPRIVYGDACTLRQAVLSKERIVFKQIPYQVRQQ